MLDILTQRRKEYADEAAKLIADRNNMIEQEVARYRQSLEASYSTADIQKIQNIIAAMDAVIAFEATKEVVIPVSQPQEIHQEAFVAAPAQCATAEHVADLECCANERPGMSAIFTPDRG